MVTDCWRIVIHYLFIYMYCHLYSAFATVQCSNVLYRLWDGKIQGHTGQPSVREIDAHTMYSQGATAPGRSLNYPRPKSITQLRTFSHNGVYVALQLILVIQVSNQWCWVLKPYSYLLHMVGMTLPIYMGPIALRGIRAMRDTHTQYGITGHLFGCWDGQSDFLKLICVLYIFIFGNVSGFSSWFILGKFSKLKKLWLFLWDDPMRKKTL